MVLRLSRDWSGGSFFYHSTLGRTVALGTPLEVVGAQSQPSYHRVPEDKNFALLASTNWGNIYFKGKFKFTLEESDLFCQ